MTQTAAQLNISLPSFEDDEPRQSKRNYGPKSTRKMTDHDAWLILYGKLRTTPVNDCCNILGVSRGQVYSCRGTYTFIHVKPTSFTE